MPNWCQNTLTIDGNPQDLRNFFIVGCKMLPEEPPGKNLVPLLFNNFVPQPVFEDKGAWYQWNTDNWGTKWDLNRGTHVTPDTIDDGNLTYTFITAWSPPIHWLAAVTAFFPHLSFNLEYEGQDYIGEATGVDGNFEDNTREMVPADYHNQGWHGDTPSIGCQECGPGDFAKFHQDNEHQPEEDHFDCTVCQHLLGQHTESVNQCPMCNVTSLS